MSWMTVPLRQLITLTSTKNRIDLPLLSVVREKGVIIRKLDKSDNHNVIPEDLSNYKVVLNGQFVINKMKAWQGSCGVSGLNGIVSPAYFVFDLRVENSRFFNYAIRSRHYAYEFMRISKGIRIGQWDLDLQQLKYVRFSLPSHEEQEKIVQYLDWRCFTIKKFIKAKQKEIHRLQEYCYTIIDNAVTKGINADAIMKQSGVNWIPNIQEHWDIVYSKQLFALRKDKALPTDIQLTSSQKHGIISQAEFMEIEGRRVVVVVNGSDILKHVEAGDFVISMRSFQGGLEYSKISGKISSAYVMLIPDTNKVCVDYYRWLFKSKSYIKALQGTSDLVRDGQALRYANFAKVPLPLFNKDEQEQIAQHLNTITTNIDTVIERLRKEIKLLDEYRTRLISDVVTGKVDVRDIEVPRWQTASAEDGTEEELDDEEMDENTESEDEGTEVNENGGND